MPLQGDRLKQLRISKGYSQEELARRLSVSQQQVARWENAANDASADAVARIARVMECTADWLLGLVEEPNQRLRAKDLTRDEQQLIELYRRGKLPPTILRLITDLSRTNAQENLVVDSETEPGITTDEETADS